MIQNKAIYLLNHEIVEQIVAPGMFNAAMSKIYSLKNFEEAKNCTEALVISRDEFKHIVEEL